MERKIWLSAPSYLSLNVVKKINTVMSFYRWLSVCMVTISLHYIHDIIVSRIFVRVWVILDLWALTLGIVPPSDDITFMMPLYRGFLFESVVQRLTDIVDM